MKVCGIFCVTTVNNSTRNKLLNTPVTRNGQSGPTRSMMRPHTGANTAIDTKYTPTTLPATLKSPSDSRMNISIAKPIMPTGMRESQAISTIGVTSG